jgi:hypothetical protein
MNEQELLQIKQQMDEAREEKTRLETRKDLILEELQTKFGVSSLVEANALLKKMEAEIDKEDEGIQEAIAKLEKQLAP